MAYAELAVLVPRSGSDYSYLMEGYGDKHSFWGPLPSFLYSFIVVLITCPVSISIVLLASAEYIIELVKFFICFENADDLELAKRAIALVLISELLYKNVSKRTNVQLFLGIITFINSTSVKLYVKVQGVFTFCKILTCLLIIGGGIYELCIGKLKINS